tara:strand:- start:541 stop:1686 length:1146 start_codon:yes stop_codon:yes gene_type:complete
MRQKKDVVQVARCAQNYGSLVKSGVIDSDKAQLAVLDQLDSFLTLTDTLPRTKKIIHSKSWFFKLLKVRDVSKALGFYIYGGVGTGKSMIMDIFFIEVRSKKKLRTHFHSFMQETHERINNSREKGERDPITVVANEISQNVEVLCFDEFQITDITDAMIVGRLFSALIAKETFIITTSNRHPDDLYKDGLNRQLFIPFIDLLKNRLNVIELHAQKDYRRDKLSRSQIYFWPINQVMREGFDKIWKSFIVEPPKELKLQIKGRIITLPKYSNGVGRSSFNELCGGPLGVLDYLTICKNIKILFVEEIPILTEMGMDSAKRFVALIDTLYESRIKIICLAQAKPEMLYPTGKGSFEFDRTVSRLYEMQSDEWIVDRDADIST